MAKHLYKASEWEINGKWHVNDTTDLAGPAGLWWMPSRVLGMTAPAYVEWLVKTYKPDHISFNKILLFSWDKEHYTLAHKYLLYINKIARQKNFQI